MAEFKSDDISLQESFNTVITEEILNQDNPDILQSHINGLVKFQRNNKYINNINEEYRVAFIIKKNIVDCLNIQEEVILNESKIDANINDSWYKIIFPNTNDMDIEKNDMYIFSDNLLQVYKKRCMVEQLKSGKSGLNSPKDYEDYTELIRELIPFLPNYIILLFHPVYWPRLIFNFLIINIFSPKTGINFFDDLEEEQKFQRIEVMTKLTTNNKLYERIKKIRKYAIKVKGSDDTDDWWYDMLTFMKNKRYDEEEVQSRKFENFLRNYKDGDSLKNNIEIFTYDAYESITTDLYDDNITKEKKLTRARFLLLKIFLSDRSYPGIKKNILGKKFHKEMSQFINKLTKRDIGTGIVAKLGKEYKNIIDDYELYVKLKSKKYKYFDDINSIWVQIKTDGYTIINLLQLFNIKEPKTYRDPTPEENEAIKEFIIYIKDIAQDQSKSEIRSLFENIESIKKSEIIKKHPVLKLLTEDDDDDKNRKINKYKQEISDTAIKKTGLNHTNINNHVAEYNNQITILKNEIATIRLHLKELLKAFNEFKKKIQSKEDKNYRNQRELIKKNKKNSETTIKESEEKIRHFEKKIEKRKNIKLYISEKEKIYDERIENLKKKIKNVGSQNDLSYNFITKEEKFLKKIETIKKIAESRIDKNELNIPVALLSIMDELFIDDSNRKDLHNSWFKDPVKYDSVFAKRYKIQQPKSGTLEEYKQNTSIIRENKIKRLQQEIDTIKPLEIANANKELEKTKQALIKNQSYLSLFNDEYKTHIENIIKTQEENINLDEINDLSTYPKTIRPMINSLIIIKQIIDLINRNKYDKIIKNIIFYYETFKNKTKTIVKTKENEKDIENMNKTNEIIKKIVDFDGRIKNGKKILIEMKSQLEMLQNQIDIEADYFEPPNNYYDNPPSKDTIIQLLNIIIQKDMIDILMNTIFKKDVENGIILYCVSEDIDKSIYHNKLKDTLVEYYKVSSYKKGDLLNKNKQFIFISNQTRSNIINMNGPFGQLFKNNACSIRATVNETGSFFYLSKLSWIHHIFNKKFQIKSIKIIFQVNVTAYEQIIDIGDIKDMPQILHIQKKPSSSKEELTALTHLHIFHNLIVGIMAELYDTDFDQLNKNILKVFNEPREKGSKFMMKYMKPYNNIRNLLFSNNRPVISYVTIEKGDKDFIVDWIKVVYELKNGLQLISTLEHKNFMIQEFINYQLQEQYYLPTQKLQAKDGEEVSNFHYDKDRMDVEEKAFNYFDLNIMTSKMNEKIKLMDNNIKTLIKEINKNNKIYFTVNTLKVNTNDKFTIEDKKHWFFMYKLQIPLLQHLINYQRKTKKNIKFDLICKKGDKRIVTIPGTQLSNFYQKNNPNDDVDKENKASISYNENKSATIYIASGSLDMVYYGEPNILITKDQPTMTIGRLLANNTSNHAEKFFEIQNCYNMQFSDINSYVKDLSYTILKRRWKYWNLDRNYTNILPYNILFANTPRLKDPPIQEKIPKPITDEYGKIYVENVIYYNNIVKPQDVNKESYKVNIKEMLGEFQSELYRLTNKINKYYNLNDDNYWKSTINEERNRVQKETYESYSKFLKGYVNDSVMKAYSPFQYIKTLLSDTYLINSIDTIELNIFIPPENDNDIETIIPYYYSVNPNKETNKANVIYEIILNRPDKGNDPLFNEFPFFDIETELIKKHVKNENIDISILSSDLNTRALLKEDETNLTNLLLVKNIPTNIKSKELFLQGFNNLFKKYNVMNEYDYYGLNDDQITKIKKEYKALMADIIDYIDAFTLSKEKRIKALDIYSDKMKQNLRDRYQNTIDNFK